MPTKTVPLTFKAHVHLLKLQEAKSKMMGIRKLPLKDLASMIILETPLPHNGNDGESSLSPAQDGDG